MNVYIYKTYAEVYNLYMYNTIYIQFIYDLYIIYAEIC